MYARHDRVSEEGHCLVLHTDTVGQGEVSFDLADGIKGNLNVVDVIHVPVRVQLPHAYGNGRGQIKVTRRVQATPKLGKIDTWVVREVHALTFGDAGRSLRLGVVHEPKRAGPSIARAIR